MVMSACSCAGLVCSHRRSRVTCARAPWSPSRVESVCQRVARQEGEQQSGPVAPVGRLVTGGEHATGREVLVCRLRGRREVPGEPVCPLQPEGAGDHGARLRDSRPTRSRAGGSASSFRCRVRGRQRGHPEERAVPQDGLEPGVGQPAPRARGCARQPGRAPRGRAEPRPPYDVPGRSGRRPLPPRRRRSGKLGVGVTRHRVEGPVPARHLERDSAECHVEQCDRVRLELDVPGAGHPCRADGGRCVEACGERSRRLSGRRGSRSGR